MLTPSPNDIPMMSPTEPRITIDMPDNTGNFIKDRNEENAKRLIGRPGGPVQITGELCSDDNLVKRGVKVRFTESSNDDDDGDDVGNQQELCSSLKRGDDCNYENDNDDNIPKVEIQITKDGQIQVISDKETTV